MDFDKIKHRTWLSWGAVALLVALCAVLAGLQYRWIGEVATAERQRLRDDLQYRLNLLRRDLNEQVSADCYAYIPTASEIEKLGRDAAYLARYRARKDAGDRVVKRIALAVPENFDLILLVPDHTGTRLLRQPWPVAWAMMQKSLLTRLRGGPAPLNQSATLVEFPRFAGTSDSSERGAYEQEWLLVDLDPDFIGRSLAPVMLQRYLGETGKMEYDAEIVSSADSSVTIYRSPSDSETRTPWVADASAALLEIGRTPFFAAGRNIDRRDSPAETRASEPPQPSQAGPPRGLWILRVHNRAGSLETIVAQARRRNILLSAGLLLLILATIAALVRFSRHAQAIAELQMNFVAGVSHELRTPLAVIRTAAYNLRGELAKQPSQVASYGALILEETEKLSALAEQVLRYGNARAGRVIQRREALAVPELIEAGLAAARSSVPASDTVIETRIEPDLPLILADRASMQHALQNLFDNAIKYGLQGGNWIGISASAAKNGGPLMVEVRVADRGPGIPEAERESIFDPFFRGQRPLLDQIHGTGLGLNLVKNIVEAHGGTITVESGEPQGAEFVVRIPGVPADEGIADDAATATPPAGARP